MRILPIRLAPVILGIVVLSWFAPQSYLRATRSEYSQTRAVYSPIEKEFIVWLQSPTGFSMTTEQSEPLSLKAGRMLLPSIFSRDVNKWGGFPLLIDGKKYSMEEAKQMQIVRMSPRVAQAGIPDMYIILESSPETSSFELPSDVMVLKKDAVHFINTDTGMIDTAKSTLFTEHIKKAGAVFPWKVAGNNPDVLKSFDEGLFFIDSNRVLFQMLMEKGRPVVRNTGHAIEGNVLTLTVSENQSKEFYGLIIAENAIYLNAYGKAPIKLPLDVYSAVDDSFNMWSTPFARTINLKTVGEIALQPAKSLATNLGYDVIRTFTSQIPLAQIERHLWVQRGLSFLSPFSFVQFTPKTPGVVFDWRMSLHPFYIFLGSLFGMFLYLIYQYFKLKQRKSFIRNSIVELCIILICGIPASIMLMAFGPVTKRDT